MIPEGLEHTSADSILDRIASAGFNFIRMLFSPPSSPPTHWHSSHH